MTHMKKILSVISTLVFAAAATALPCLSGCAKSTVKEITIKVPRSSTINSVARPDITNAYTLMSLASEDFVKQYGKDVKINVVEFEAGEETKAITNTFGTDDAVDILYDGFFNMSSFIHTGNAVPLDDVLPAEALADLNSTYVTNGKFNGKLYMLPYMASQNILIYNKEMLRQCGLDEYASAEKGVISHWTIEEWTTILDTLAENLPDGSVPMMMYAKDNQGDTHIMTILRAFGSDLFDDDGNFNFVDDPAAMQAFEWLQRGVDKGWYLPVAYFKTMSDNSSKFKMDELAFYNFNLGSSNYNKAQNDQNDKYGFVNYPGDKCTFFCEGFEVFDNGDSEKIAVAKDFIRYFYATDGWLECSAGSIPVSGKVMEKYSGQIFLLDEFNKNAVNAVDFTRNLPNWQGGADSVRSVFYKEIAKLLMQNVDGTFEYSVEEVAKSLQDKLNAAVQSGRANSRYID